MPTQQIKMTTPGEWFVTTIDDQIAVVNHNQHGSTIRTIAIFGDEDSPLADEHIANAALLAISKDLLDIVIAIQMELNTSKDVIDLRPINKMISDVFAKLANEAGEEL